MEPTQTATLLSKRVWKRSLPLLTVPTGADAPSLRRISLPQGELAQIHDAEEGMRFIAPIELREGTTRGNHFHLKKREYVYMLSGECFLVVEERESKAREQVAMVQGDLAFIPPGIAHVLRVTASGWAIEFSPERFDPADTIRYPMPD